MGFLSNLLGLGNSKRTEELLEGGATVVDVRTPGEYRAGHVAGSKNIPLNQLKQRLPELKKSPKSVIFCCASGARSGQATSMAKRAGIECENGGSWTKVNRLLKS